MISFALLQLGFPINNQNLDTNVNVDDALLLSFKLLYIVLAFLFVIFAFVVIRQINVMNDTVTTKLGPILQIVSYLVFGLSIILLLAALFRL